MQVCIQVTSDETRVLLAEEGRKENPKTESTRTPQFDSIQACGEEGASKT